MRSLVASCQALSFGLTAADFAVDFSCHALVAFFLSLLLVFRTTDAYDRFWEGRKAWAEVVLAFRNLTRQCLTLNIPSKTCTGDDFFSLPIVTGFSLMHQLRENPWGDERVDLAPLVTQHTLEMAASVESRPAFFLALISQHLDEAYAQGTTLEGCRGEGASEAREGEDDALQC